jgi:hypothetical protein
MEHGKNNIIINFLKINKFPGIVEQLKDSGFCEINRIIAEIKNGKTFFIIK